MRDRLRTIIVFGCITLLLAACSMPLGGFLSGVESIQHPAQPTSIPATSTPTPFEPMGQVGTPWSGEIPTQGPNPSATLVMPESDPWGDFEGPTQLSAIEIPPPVTPLILADDVVNILLMGSDEAPDRYGHRTDTMIILSLDPSLKRVVMLSIPRDLYVYIPGWRVDRVNVASIFGGTHMVKQTMLYNFGVEIDYWAFINFEGFTRAIDQLDGVEVEVGGFLKDSCGGKTWNYSPGTYHMDGYSALCYVRMRKASSDFDRMRRQQEVVRAIFRRVLSLDGLSRVPQLYSEFGDLLDTDMDLGAMLPLLPLAKEMALGDVSIESFSIDPKVATSWIVPSSGAWVLLPDRDAMQALVREAFLP